MTAPTIAEEVYDIIVVGSGGGSAVAGMVARSLGKRALIVEKSDKFGGSTAFSGGVWWVPGHSLLREAGIADSYEQANTYLDAVVDSTGPATAQRRRDAFLHAAPRMIDFLRACGLKVKRPDIDWPDYYDDRPGGLPEGRSLVPEPFDLNDLGEMAQKLALYPPMIAMPIGADQAPRLMLVRRTWAGKIAAVKLGTAILRDKVLGRRTVTTGAAIQGRMLDLLLRHRIEFRLGTPVVDLVNEAGRVAGIVIEEPGGGRRALRARDGVIVNAGGYARNRRLREAATDGWVGDAWTSANPGDTGELIERMVAAGAATEALDSAWWVLTSQGPGNAWPEGAVGPDETVMPFTHHLDLSLPFSILVDRSGRRFANEAGSYMEIGERLLRRQRETGQAIPSWVIFDARHRDRYSWGWMPPGTTPESWLASGYMKKAASLGELAETCGIALDGLVMEVERFNAFCRSGVDEDFGRGGKAFDRMHGDPTVRPNPNLGPIDQAPFYAVAVYPGDVGTAGGVVTDEFARVLRDDGQAIPGLYAVGNSAASLFGRAYPGAGASISSAFTFGFVAAHHALGSNVLHKIVSP